MINNSPFLDNVVIITGASGGIGRALSYLMADQGALLSLCARDEKHLEAVAAECRTRGAKVLVVPADVSDREQCSDLIRRTVREFARVDTLINNAGISMWARFEDMHDLAPFEEIMKVNYLGSVYCTYYALPHLKKTRGRIVGISSVAGRTGLPNRSGYAASKHAMTGFFDSLRPELRHHNVSVTMAYPGFVASDIRKKAFGKDGKPLGRSPVREGKIMSADTCAGIILNAAAKRKREVIIGARGNMRICLRLLAPGLLERILCKTLSKRTG